MGCCCQSILEKILKEIEGVQKHIESEDEPYSARMVSSDFLKKIAKKYERLDCNCEIAIRINKALDFLSDRSVQEFLAESGGGSMIQRTEQEAAYIRFKNIITDQKNQVPMIIFASNFMGTSN